jgi:hypothetical protein
VAGIEKVESAEAMRRSQLMATFTPPPMQNPRMQATLHCFLLRAQVFELRDIGAGDECLVALSRENDHANVVVPLRRRKQGRHRFPHIERERVVLRRMVEANVQHLSLAPCLDALGGGSNR